MAGEQFLEANSTRIGENPLRIFSLTSVPAPSVVEDGFLGGIASVFAEKKEKRGWLR